MPAILKSGAMSAPGGKRRHAGRKPNWFKKLCEEELWKRKASSVHLAGEISRGEAKVEKIFHHEGKIIRAETLPSPSDAIQASEFLRDSAFGRPSVEVDVVGASAIDLTAVLAMIAQSRSERGLPND